MYVIVSNKFRFEEAMLQVKFIDIISEKLSQHSSDFIFEQIFIYGNCC